MKKFNETVRDIFEANNIDYKTFDPVMKADELTTGGELWGKHYKPQFNLPVTRDPDAPNLKAINHATYKYLLKKCFGLPGPEGEKMGVTKKALITFGRPGIGKSFVVKDVVEEIGSTRMKKSNPQEPREVVMFHQVPDEMQKQVLSNPGDYFVLIDIRTAQLEPSDLMGIPHFSKDEKDTDKPLHTVKYKWSYLATHPDAEGYLFFDEINQGAPEVINAMYNVILDRVIFDKPLANGIAVCAAGNLIQHDPSSKNDPLGSAILRRFQRGVVSLLFDPDSWLEWAISKHIHPMILSFVMSDKKKNLYRRSDSSTNRIADPDSITNLSKFFYTAEQKFYSTSKGKDFRYNDLLQEYDRLTRTILGAEWGKDFGDFIGSFDPSSIKKTTESGTCTPDRKWASIGLIQQMMLYILENDPNFTDSTTPQIIKTLTDWIQVIGKDNITQFNNALFNHGDQNIHVNLMLMRDKIKKLPASKPDEKTSKAVDAFFSKFDPSYKSEYEVYSNEQETTNLLKTNHKGLVKSLEHTWDHRESLLVYGDPGIGKSWSVKDFGRRKAQEMTNPKTGEPLIFLDINCAPKSDIGSKEPGIIEDLIKNPGKYFVFIDVRTAYLSPADFMGIPDVFSGSPYLKTKPFLWSYVATIPNITGIVFFDEINQAAPQVINALYSVINLDDRKIFDRPMSKNLMVVGAANLKSQVKFGQREELTQALTRRFKAGTVALTLDADEWLNWAINQQGTKNEIHKILLTFIMAHMPKERINYIFRNSEDDYSPPVTPDTLVTLSQNLRHFEHDVKQMEAKGATREQLQEYYVTYFQEEISSVLPPDYAEELMDFMYKLRAIDWDEILQMKTLFSNPYEVRKKAKEMGKEGKGVLGTMFAFIPYEVDVIKRLLTMDPQLKAPKSRQRAVEIIDLFTYFEEQYGSSFFTYFKALGGTETFTYFLNLIQNVPNLELPKGMKEKAGDLFKKIVKITKRATEGGV